jgi:hypothetical protein
VQVLLELLELVDVRLLELPLLGVGDVHQVPEQVLEAAADLVADAGDALLHHLNPLELALLDLVDVQDLLQLHPVQDHATAANSVVYPETVLILDVEDAPLELVSNLLELADELRLHLVEVLQQSVLGVLQDLVCFCLAEGEYIADVGS